MHTRIHETQLDYDPRYPNANDLADCAVKPALLASRIPKGAPSPWQNETAEERVVIMAAVDTVMRATT